MRLTLATGLLAQTLPVSLGDVNSLGRSKENPKPPFAQGSFQIRSQHEYLRPSLRTQNSLGLHSNGVLKTSPSDHPRLCDPSSIDADVGILSCDAGYFCMTMSESNVGGVCTPMTLNDWPPIPASDVGEMEHLLDISQQHDDYTSTISVGFRSLYGGSYPLPCYPYSLYYYCPPPPLTGGEIVMICMGILLVPWLLISVTKTINESHDETTGNQQSPQPPSAVVAAIFTFIRIFLCLSSCGVTG